MGRAKPEALDSICESPLCAPQRKPTSGLGPLDVGYLPNPTGSRNTAAAHSGCSVFFQEDLGEAERYHATCWPGHVPVVCHCIACAIACASGISSSSGSKSSLSQRLNRYPTFSFTL